MVENVLTISLQIMIRVLMQTPKWFFGYHFDQIEIKNTYNPLEKGYNSEFQLKIHGYMNIVK